MEPVLISADFTLAEACKSETAVRKCIDNTPPPEALPRIAAVAQNILQPILENYGRVPAINSFYRCPAVNKAVGGRPDSQHLRGEAVDLEMPGLSNVEFARWISSRLKFDQLILEYHTIGVPTSGWVHVSFIDERAPENVAAGRRNAGEVLTIGKGFSFHGLPA